MFWNSESRPILDAQDLARDLESWGYGSLFVPEGAGKDVLVQTAAFLAATERLVVGSGIANIHVRLPAKAETGSRMLNALYPNRFVLGLGVSHAGFVEKVPGAVWGKPLGMMRDYLDQMDAAASGVEPAVARPARLLAALGPRMVNLSGQRADGALPYLVTPRHTRSTRAALGTDRWIVSQQTVAIGGDGDDQLRRAHAHLEMYIPATNYQNSWLRQGFARSDFVPGGSEQLARGLIAMGSPDAAAAAVTAHLDAGADHVVVQIAGDTDSSDPRPALRQLATVLTL